MRTAFFHDERCFWHGGGNYALTVPVGGYVQPHATAKTLRILPRYPSVPWEWDVVAPHVELPAAAASVESVTEKR